MRILGIDSSSLVASVAIVEDEIMIAEYTTNFKKTHSQTLLPMIDEITKMTDIDISTIDAIAVSGGPGSFTGLRIGSATAKGLGLALNKPLIHIPTLEAMAYNFLASDRYICPLMDARRNQVYTGIYHFEEKTVDDKRISRKLVADMDQCALSVEELVQKLNSLDEKVIFVGDGMPVLEKYLLEQADMVKFQYYFAPAHLNRQRAGAVAALGAVYAEEGRFQRAEDHSPEYLRLSQAERERNEKV